MKSAFHSRCMQFFHLVEKISNKKGSVVSDTALLKFILGRLF